MKKYTQSFYSNSAALSIELSENGCFIGIANFKERNPAGNNTYDWQNKKQVKITAEELSVFLEAIPMQKKGDDKFAQYCNYFFGNPKYKSMLLVHDKGKSNHTKDNTKQILSFGIGSYKNNMSFQINQGQDKRSLTFTKAGRARFEKFLNFVLNKMFERESFTMKEGF